MLPQPWWLMDRRVELVAWPRARVLACRVGGGAGRLRPMSAALSTTERAAPWLLALYVLSRHALLMCPGLGWPLHSAGRRQDCAQCDSIISVIYSVP